MRQAADIPASPAAMQIRQLEAREWRFFISCSWLRGAARRQFRSLSWRRTSPSIRTRERSFGS
ncbi:hypothetical protein B0H17DRAFT_1100965 [Mycena rosella]|uniref:Uncharacterized protein n=1 Tax=Mycena rosella TaxID=1033263 RepID=A0AAD7G3P5_MYCRO|nr:hypothetical protein B0H17DRAFT_1100965 [Mycena rosella]